MSEFEISVHDIVPALLPFSREFFEEQKQELVKKAGNITRMVIHVFSDDEDDEEAPCVLITSFTNGERLMCFSLEAPDDGMISIMMPLKPEGEIKAEDILFTIKQYADRTDMDKLQEELIVAGKTRGTPPPHKIN